MAGPPNKKTLPSVKADRRANEDCAKPDQIWKNEGDFCFVFNYILAVKEVLSRYIYSILAIFPKMNGKLC